MLNDLQLFCSITTLLLIRKNIRQRKCSSYSSYFCSPFPSICPKRNLSIGRKGHKEYPDLLHFFLRPKKDKCMMLTLVTILFSSISNNNLIILRCAKFCSCIGHADSITLCFCDNFFTFFLTYTLCNFSAIFSIVHH